MFSWLRKRAFPPRIKLHHFAVVYRSNGVVIVAPIVRTKGGIGMEVEPRLVPQPIDPVRLGEMIEEALASAYRVARDDGTGFQPFLKIVKVRSYKAFMRDARRIWVLKSADGFLVAEDENRGSRGFGSERDPTLVSGTTLDVARKVLDFLANDPPGPS